MNLQYLYPIIGLRTRQEASTLLQKIKMVEGVYTAYICFFMKEIYISHQSPDTMQQLTKLVQENSCILITHPQEKKVWRMRLVRRYFNRLLLSLFILFIFLSIIALFLSSYFLK